jgi:hypothetical protein
MAKIRVWHERRGATCKLRVEGAENARFLIGELSKLEPNLGAIELRNLADTPLCEFFFRYTEKLTPTRVAHLLRTHPAIELMRESTYRVRQLPHFRIAADELAKWLAQQPKETWWTVDGDPLLTQRIDFPCPSEDLAETIRGLKKRLLVLDSRLEPSARGETVSAMDLDRLAFTDEHDDRVFQLSWQDSEPDADWFLVEDKETGKNVAELEHSER